MDTVQLNYTIINHVAREKLGLSMHEYAVADLIYHLSNNPEAEIKGWCYASKDWLGESLGVNKRSIYRMLEVLITKGLLEKNIDTKFLRTTPLWYKSVIIKQAENELEKDSDKMSQGVTFCHTSSDKMSHVGSDKMSHNNDINNNDSTKNFTNVKEKSPLQENKFGNPDINEAIELLKSYTGTVPREQLNRYAVKRLITTRGKDRLLKAIRFVFINRDDRYCPTISNFLDLEQKWTDLETYARRAIAGTRGGVNNKHYDATTELRTGGLDNPVEQNGISLITG